MINDSAAGPVLPNGTERAGHTYEQGLGAGERNADSATLSYLVAGEAANIAVISKVTAVTIGAGAANDIRLLSVEIMAALTGTCAITGFADSDGAAQTITYPAASAAGVRDWDGAINSAGALTFTCSNVADDNLVIVRWRALA